jgi:signal transduction histidine kinase
VAFRPIDIIAQTAQSIVSAADLERRVPVPSAQDELQRLTLTINDLLDRLQALFNAQRRFLADASHELRTPLAAMKGNIDILQRGAVRDKVLLEESLYDMRHETDRLIRLVNDLLMLAKNETTESMRLEIVDLTSLVLEVVRELRPLAQQQRVELRLDVHDVVMLNGDRDRLKQALLNLCMNALQHTPAEGNVTCALVRSGEMVQVHIRDTGVGIAPEDLPHIFERFYRADRSRTRQTHVTSTGAGLGLAIVKYIVEAHGGSVTVESTVRVGTVFHVVLPCLPELSFDDE